MTEIEIYHDFTHCNHYIPNKIINLKNHKKYIFHILREKMTQIWPKRDIFEFSQKIRKRHFFPTPKTRLSKTSTQCWVSRLIST